LFLWIKHGRKVIRKHNIINIVIKEKGVRALKKRLYVLFVGIFGGKGNWRQQKHNWCVLFVPNSVCITNSAKESQRKFQIF